ncbi:hypothetical protein DPX16_17487 [Anabarilius grahami]|uniref:Uncharacterized protein n=1 Tax=Anabarilius grahami TaxID=495550 RepID=A0A3N0XZ39_ANAGA|nr:hypothetical protein DPX16_17487 [Anabarilius grahami]
MQMFSLAGIVRYHGNRLSFRTSHASHSLKITLNRVQTVIDSVHYSRGGSLERGLAQNAASASRSGISSGQGLLRQLLLERHLQRPRHRHLAAALPAASIMLF